MKKLILTIAVVLTTFSLGLAQSVNQTDYDLETLKTKTKTQLTEIYLNKFQSLITTLPYTSFTLKQDTMVVDTTTEVSEAKYVLDIPDTRYTNRKRVKVSTEAKEYNKVIKEQLMEIIPYSDKNEIIWGILFLQNINSKLNTNF